MLGGSCNLKFGKNSGNVTQSVGEIQIFLKIRHSEDHHCSKLASQVDITQFGTLNTY